MKNIKVFSISQKFQLFLKRIIDFCVSAISLLLLLIPLILISILIKTTSRGSILFRQERLGRYEKTFLIYKFRTMLEGASQTGTGVTTLPNDSRLTSVGRFLRKSSIDELPQLINVLKGEMSLIGPRPTVPDHLEYYGDFERQRLYLRPGITGLAMIRGRSSNPWSIRIKYDVQYIHNYSLLLDLHILIKTILLVIKRESTEYDYSNHGDAFDLTKPGETDSERKRRLEV